VTSVARHIAVLCVALLALGPIFGVLADEAEYVDLPDLPESEAIPLKVAFLINPEFPNFSEHEWREVLDFTTASLEEHLQLTVVFSEPEAASLEAVFSELDRRLPEEHVDYIANIHSGEIDWDRMTEAIRYTLPQHLDGIEAAHAEVARLLDGDVPGLGIGNERRKRNRLAVILTDVLEEKLEGLRSFGQDGFLARSSRPGLPGFNEWVYWDALPSLDLPYDIYLTNQPILSVEYFAYPLHAVMRSGATFGSTSASAASEYGTASIASSFFFLDNGPDTVELRNGVQYSRADAIRLTGWLLAHEIGHQLLHLAHPWENTACLMRPSNFTPPEVFAENLDSTACSVGSSPDMTPGAARIPIAYELED